VSLIKSSTVPATARAAVMTAAKAPLEMREYPLPEPGPGQVLVRVRACTICKSDLLTWTGARPGPVPAILGHEIVGEIVALGEGRSHDAGDRRLGLGDRITWTIHDSCGQCYHCRDLQLPMKCRSLKKYGHDSCAEPPHFEGGFAEYCLLGAGTSIVRAPASVDDLVLAPANCALSTVMAGFEAAEFVAGQSVWIQGAGGLGCYAAAVATHRGARRVIVSDTRPERLEFAGRFGATERIDVRDMSDDQICSAVKDLSGGHGVDSVLELAGRPELIPQGLGGLRKGGCFVELGCSFPGAKFELDASLVLWNLLTIRGVHNYDTRHLRQAVEFLDAAGERFPFRELVTHEFDFEDVQAAVDCAQSGVGLRVAILFPTQQT
jgi:putative phosphonate catabolism associated alcohol dehydrogenase